MRVPLYCRALLLLSTAYFFAVTPTTAFAAIRCEIWPGIEGGQITDTLAQGDLSVPAGETRSLDAFELNPAPDQPDACAVRGFIIPPTTGDYTFSISGDDTALLYLSKDDSSDNVKVIASVPSYTGVRDFLHFAAQTSRPIHLIADKHYFIEAFLKNNLGASHLSVGWKLPNGTGESPIPGNRLLPATGDVPAPGARVLTTTLTLKADNSHDLTPGFRKFRLGAHAVVSGEPVDFSYLLYSPRDMARTQYKVPLMIFLHGNGHQGTDLEGCLNEGPAQCLRDDRSLANWFPMVGLFPQLPGDWRWDTPGAPQMVNGLIKAICDKYPRIDRNRIYLTGLSMGGKGSWLTVLDSPQTFATVTTFSAVSVRPNVAKSKLMSLKNIHIICGGDDGDFAAGSKQMYEALQPTMGSRVQLTVVDHEGHGVWGRYYPNKAIYEEMMKFSK